jgi:hypothetical protein
LAGGSDASGIFVCRPRRHGAHDGDDQDRDAGVILPYLELDRS